MIKLGDKVRDQLTDLCGTAVARCVYIYGCIQVQVLPQGLHDGHPVEECWVDEARLVVVGEKKPEKQPEKKSKREPKDPDWMSFQGPHGPKPHPSVRSHPK